MTCNSSRVNITLLLETANTMMMMVRETRPDLYAAILQKIQPYSLKSVIKIFAHHLLSIPNLQVFNENLNLVPEFVWTVIKYMKFPEPGDAIGIFIISRLTKTETQCTLDSKHIPSITNSHNFEFNVEKDILDELSLFSNHIQIFELANRHKYATVFLSEDTEIEFLLSRLPDACVLERGMDFNKGRNALGCLRYLISFKYIIVEDRGSVKVLYKSLSNLYVILRRVPLKHITAFSDVRCVFRKCGITSAFFNMVQVAQRQLFTNKGSNYDKDVVSILRFMFCRGELLPMNREGLAKNKDKPPIDVISFEAMKRNCARIVTGPKRDVWHPVHTSSENIFYGKQFNEGTGYSFTLHNDESKRRRLT